MVEQYILIIMSNVSKESFISCHFKCHRKEINVKSHPDFFSPWLCKIINFFFLKDPSPALKHTNPASYIEKHLCPTFENLVNINN